VKEASADSPAPFLIPVSIRIRGQPLTGLLHDLHNLLDRALAQ
jgi:hypothetical protein